MKIVLTLQTSRKGLWDPPEALKPHFESICPTKSMNFPLWLLSPDSNCKLKKMTQRTMEVWEEYELHSFGF